ncbi:hypothetical protein V6N11_025746 [Hibiscus sabdariffa]|uniref:Uncharacterized protein n=1 Tax=Hibiscus sabdariffa TaxID=183260 RepID=A0ABR2STW4_9ROSI
MYSSNPSSPMTSFLPSSQDPFNKTVDPPNDDEQQLHRLPTLSEALEEIKAIGKISGPTSISNLLLYSRAMISMLCLSYLGELELAGGGWSSLLALALPTCASVCLKWCWYELMILLCGLLVSPKATIASMGILIQTTALVYRFPSALSVRVSTRIGNELGANRPGKARISMIVSAFCGLAIAVALPIVWLCELENYPQTAGCGVLRGIARPTIEVNINLGSFYIVGMPMAILMGFVVKMGFLGLWLGLLAAQAACALMMLLVLYRTDWMVQVERA